MKYRVPIFACLIVTSATFRLHAQDAPPVDPKAVLAALSAVKAKQHDVIKSTETKLAQQFMALAASPTDAVAYYTEAIFNTQFNGQSHEGTEFQAWKKKHEEELKDKTFRYALCLHLMYLSMAITHDSGVKIKDQLPDLLTYIQQVKTDADDLYGQEEFMRQPLSNSIFVRSLQIGQYLADDKTWEPVPMNIDGMFQKMILPEYRRTKNSSGLFQYWDDRIQREEDSATKSKRTFDIDKFNQTTKPGLLWLRAQEFVELGQKNNAIKDMMTVINAYPFHEDAPDWIAQVEAMVKAPAIDPAPAPVPAATPVPAPASTPAAAATPAATPTPASTPHTVEMPQY